MMTTEPVPTTAGAPVLDGGHIRQVLGHVPTAVCVVTTLNEGQPCGSTVGTFTSVSLDPPLIAFFSQHTSDMLAAVRKHGSFAVNVLAADQAEICQIFSRKGPERFEQVGWAYNAHGTPQLAGTLASLQCRVEAVTEVGDHAMVLGRVHALDALRPRTEPLVFFTGALHGTRTLDPGPA